jgi:hypothetical protein
MRAGWLGQKLRSSVSTKIVRIAILPRDPNTRLMYAEAVRRNGWPEFDYNKTEHFIVTGLTQCIGPRMI